jgi:cytidine deaminase
MALTNEHLTTIETARQSSGGRIPAEVVARLVAEGIPIEQLMLDLIPIAKTYAIPPISNFFVGAVALGDSGALYLGANYEFRGQALNCTVHGEQAATAGAIAFGETGLQRLAVSAPPCGYCRQFLNELTTASTLQIHLPDTPTLPLTSLLPHAFGPADLGVAAGLMSPQSHGLVLAEPSNDPVVAAALRAANASYAPYSNSYSGVALQTSDDAIYTGSIAENAAFNPSMSPLEVAVVNLVIYGGKKYSDIMDAVLVEVPDAVASQIPSTIDVLSAISRAPLRVYRAVKG